MQSQGQLQSSTHLILQQQTNTSGNNVVGKQSEPQSHSSVGKAQTNDSMYMSWLRIAQ